MAIRKHSKKSWKGVETYFKQVIALYEARGIEMKITTPFNRDVVSSRFEAQGKALCDGGILDIHVYDWVHMRMALPENVSNSMLNLNRHSGKWNFHTDSHGIDNPVWQAEFLEDLNHNLDLLNVRKLEIQEVSLTLDEARSQPIEQLVRDEKMGVRYTITDFDRVGIVQEMAADWAKDQEETIVNISTRWTLDTSDVSILRMKLEHDQRKLETTQAAQIEVGASPKL